MIWWIFALFVVWLLSYLADAGVLSSLHDLRVPGLDISILTFLILLCLLGLIGRMLYMERIGEKERLEKKIQALKKELTSTGSKPESIH